MTGSGEAGSAWFVILEVEQADPMKVNSVKKKKNKRFIFTPLIG
jgi:hypothetical protein